MKHSVIRIEGDGIIEIKHMAAPSLWVFGTGKWTTRMERVTVRWKKKGRVWQRISGI